MSIGLAMGDDRYGLMLLTVLAFAAIVIAGGTLQVLLTIANFLLLSTLYSLVFGAAVFDRSGEGLLHDIGLTTLSLGLMVISFYFGRSWNISEVLKESLIAKLFAGSTLVTLYFLENKNVTQISRQLIAEDNSVWNAATSSAQDGLFTTEVGGSKALAQVLHIMRQAARISSPINPSHWASEVIQTTQQTYVFLTIVSGSLFGCLVASLMKVKDEDRNTLRPLLAAAVLTIVAMKLFYRTGALSGLLGSTAVLLLLLYWLQKGDGSKLPTLWNLIALSLVLPTTWWPLGALSVSFFLIAVLPELKEKVGKHFGKASRLITYIFALCVAAFAVRFSLTNSVRIRNLTDQIAVNTQIWLPISAGWTVVLVVVIAVATGLSNGTNEWFKVRPELLGKACAAVALPSVLLWFVALQVAEGSSYGLAKWSNITIIPLLLAMVFAYFPEGIRSSWVRLSSASTLIVLTASVLLIPSLRYSKELASLTVNPRMQSISSQVFLNVSQLEEKGLLVCLSSEAEGLPSRYTLMRAAYYCSRQANAYSVVDAKSTGTLWTYATTDYDGANADEFEGLLVDSVHKLYSQGAEITVLWFGPSLSGDFAELVPSGYAWFKSMDQVQLHTPSFGPFSSGNPAEVLLSVAGSL